MPYQDYHREHRFSNRRALERITGVEYPKFKVVEYKRDTMGRMDFGDRVTIEFNEIPPTAFYQALDSLIATKQSDWVKCDNTYSYSKIWGNGEPAPKGKDDEEDMHFSISFEKGGKQASISYGA
jgi:hypothetical protein